MSNVVAFRPRRRPERSQNIAALLRGVAQGRRAPDDVFWMKENAEVLSVLSSLSEPLMPGALAPFERFYDTLEEQLGFFPQYYRFFLSICLDLEDLGLDGCKGQSICHWIDAVGLVQAELSDLQRAEASCLLARRGAGTPLAQGDLGARLAGFVERPQTFALPNKKAAYELTHIVFYLSQWGKVDPRLSEAALVSLEFTGLVAYLDQDHDLLAEICLALHFAGHKPSAIWMQAVSQAHRDIVPAPAVPGMVAQDGFHAYLVTGWAEAMITAQAFEAEIPAGPLAFAPVQNRGSALRPLSECLFCLGGARRSDWSRMRRHVIPQLDETSRSILEEAEESSPRFEWFFEGFSRAAPG